jgi:hypothetical protein
VILYLNGHDKFPELGDEDALPIRWRAADAPPIPLRLRRTPGVLAESAVSDVGIDADLDVPEGDRSR